MIITPPVRLVINKLLIVSFIIFSLFIVSCDLFTGPKVDLFQVISDEVDWANAPKLTVRVEHPALWGISNPTGNITPAKDIRKGYPFEIEFTPAQAYSLTGWRAYETSSLPDGWQFDTSFLDDIERLDGVSVLVPELPAKGGTGSFTINTTANVTLIPWCKTEPYVLRTVPHHSPANVYPRGTAIEIFFNAPLALTPDVELSALFTPEIIKITATNKTTNETVLISDNNYSYNYPVYTANNDLGEYKITITPTNVPGDSLIEVTVGPNILNASNTKMAEAKVFSFGTSPALTGGGSIETWDASYSGSVITVNWETTDGVSVAARYRVNKGADIALPGVSPRTIIGVSQLDDSSVSEGRSVSGIQEYEVFLDLFIEGLKSNVGSKSFKIWNIPGMSVSYDNPAVEIITEADLAAIRTPAQNNPYYGLGVDNAAKQYVLANDIAVNTWTPIGTAPPPSGADTNSFQGKFYGNGHTVSIGGFAVPNGVNADMGLFGAVGGGFIRDLTVQYSGGINRSGETRFGGIAGTMSGTAKMENVLVKGDVSVTVVSDDEMYAGGIAGLMLGDAEISNAYGGLNLTVEHLNASHESYEGSSVMVGGITGSIGIHNLDRYSYGLYANAKIYDATVEGNINVNAATAKTDSDFDSQFGLFVGGIIGFMKYGTASQFTLDNTYYRRGHINITSAAGDAYLGCAIGYIVTGKIQNCYSSASDFVIIKNTERDSNNYLIVGGFIGFINQWPGNLINSCHSDIPINISCSNDTFVGGFIGFSYTDQINYCYSNSSVTVISLSAFAGGFCGTAGGSFQYCYASGDVKVTCPNDIGMSSIGGFAGDGGGVIRNCYALGNVVGSGHSVCAGGLIGRYYGYLNNSFSTGTVNVSDVLNTIGIDSPASGGLIGFISPQSGITQNNAALCKSVTKTDDNTSIGRIYGYLGTFGTFRNNYAYSGMKINTTIPSSTDDTGKDGKNISFEDFHFQDFWKNPVNAASPVTPGLGFDPAHWIFDTVGSYGYPILRASDGTEMGGQRR